MIFDLMIYELYMTWDETFVLGNYLVVQMLHSFYKRLSAVIICGSL